VKGMNKSEREVLVAEIEALKQNMEAVKYQLKYFQDRVKEKPWDAELDRQMKDQEHLLACVEFNLKTLQAKLRENKD